jgi:hypothetical protein
LELGDRLSTGATLVSATGFASRKTTPLATSLAANASVDATTLSLNANPGIGAFITVNNGGSTEEDFKVSNVTGSSPWVCTITPAAMYAHSISESVDYEPGVSARLLVTTSVAIDGGSREAYPLVRRGAEGKTYRITVIVDADNGERVEGEVDVLVSEIAATETEEKQPSEIMDLAFGFGANLDGGTLSSAVGYVARESTLTTTLAASSAAEDSTLSLTANPGVGALITVNPSAPLTGTKEIFTVTAVGGSGPYSCTILPTAEFAHSNGETVEYWPGESSRMLVSSTASIVSDEAILRARRGDSSETYLVKVLGTTSLSEVLQHSGHLATPEY